MKFDTDRNTEMIIENTNVISAKMPSNDKVTDQIGYRELVDKVAVLKKDYELKRFDHCKVLNSVINRHRYELILNLCACFSGFETFFHVVCASLYFVVFC